MKHVTFSLSLILGLTLAVWPITPVRAATNNFAEYLCTSCTTVGAFENYAQEHIPSGAYFTNSAGTPSMEVLFNIFNP